MKAIGGGVGVGSNALLLIDVRGTTGHKSVCFISVLHRLMMTHHAAPRQ